MNIYVVYNGGRYYIVKAADIETAISGTNTQGWGCTDIHSDFAEKVMADYTFQDFLIKPGTKPAEYFEIRILMDKGLYPLFLDSNKNILAYEITKQETIDVNKDEPELP